MHVDGPEKATPVLVLHGLTRDAGCWAWLVDALGDRARVLRLDARGHGTSDRADGAYMLQDHVDDAVDVLEKIVRRPAVVVGHSLGGIVGATVAQQRPDLVAGVVLVDPALQLGEPWPTPGVGPCGPVIDMLDAQVRDVPAALAAGTTPDEHAATVAARPTGFGDTYGTRYVEGVPLAWARAELQCDLAVIAPVRHPSAEHLGAGWDPGTGVAVPGVVLAADRTAPNRVTRRIDAQRTPTTSPRLEWREVPGAGHEMNDEPANRPVVLAAIHDVLEGLGR